MLWINSSSSVAFLATLSVLLFLLSRRKGRPKPKENSPAAFKQVTQAFGPLVTVVYPESVRHETDKKFLWAGLNDMRATDLLALKLASATVFPALALLFLLSGKSAVPLLLAALLGYIFPDIWLNRKIQERQGKIRRDVPDFAVLLATVLDAGGGDLQTALVQVGRRLGGEIGMEVEITLHEIGSGKRRSQALQNMADRCGVEELAQLIRVIVQSEYYGSPVADAVKSFAGQARTMRRFEAEKRAREQTVKMVLPMLLLIVLPLMVLLAYPALQQFGRVLGH